MFYAPPSTDVWLEELDPDLPWQSRYHFIALEAEKCLKAQDPNLILGTTELGKLLFPPHWVRDAATGVAQKQIMTKLGVVAKHQLAAHTRRGEPFKGTYGKTYRPWFFHYNPKGPFVADIGPSQYQGATLEPGKACPTCGHKKGT